MVKLSEDGSFQLPFLLILMCLFLYGLGTWGILRRWNSLVETQLHLDRCVGQTALEFRDLLIRLEEGNQKISFLRGSIVAALPTPAGPKLIPALRTALKLVVLGQDGLQLKWKMKQGKWRTLGSCGKWEDHASPLPQLKYIRPSPDVIGPLPLQWIDMPFEFHFHVWRSPRHAAARVRKEEESWKAQWSIPPVRMWPNFP
jgi:hypothetical protein